MLHGNYGSMILTERKNEMTAIRPMVGVMPLWDDDKDSLWMLPGYLDGIRQAGGVPVIFPLVTDEAELKQLTEVCDGFLLTGGHDVSPEIYGETPRADLVCTCERRDRMEDFVLKEAVASDKPVLGICRGIQFINAALGGSLYQDLPTQHPSVIEHHQHGPYDVPSHTVAVIEDSPLYGCLQETELAVNSYHHQAVRDLAPGLESMAVSPDGLVEALYMPEHPFLWAVQWHPEFSWKTDAASRKIFRAFVRSMEQG